MKSILVALCLGVMASPLLAQADDVDEDRVDRRRRSFVSPSVGLWWMDFHGKIKSSEGPDLGSLTEGTTLSLDEDLNLPNDGLLYYELMFLQTDRRAETEHVYELINLNFFYLPLDANKTLEQTEIFNGQTYAAGTNVHSSFRLWQFGIDGTVEMQDLGRDGEVEAFVGLRVWDVEIEVDTDGTNRNDEKLRLGFIGGGAAIRFHPWKHAGISARAAAFWSGGSSESVFEFQDWNGYHFEGEIGTFLDVGNLRFNFGARIIAAVADVVKEDAFAGEEDEWAFSIGGLYLDMIYKF